MLGKSGEPVGPAGAPWQPLTEPELDGFPRWDHGTQQGPWGWCSQPRQHLLRSSRVVIFQEQTSSFLSVGAQWRASLPELSPSSR